MVLVRVQPNYPICSCSIFSPRPDLMGISCQGITNVYLKILGHYTSIEFRPRRFITQKFFVVSVFPSTITSTRSLFSQVILNASFPPQGGIYRLIMCVVQT